MNSPDPTETSILAFNGITSDMVKIVLEIRYEILFDLENKRTGEEHNFKMHDPTEINLLNSEYDIGSVMHYGPYFFAKDPTKKTIVNKYQLPVGVQMGQRAGPSAVSILIDYKCSRLATRCSQQSHK
jgi:hypothetical protein